MTLRWGICCCGLISEDFTSAMCEYHDLDNKAVAVAARNLEKAKSFAKRFKIEYYFDNYEQLASCDDVDIVYVGAIDSEHCKLTKLFLNHGKHVLVEKSMGLNVSETKEMIELARDKKLFLMEGVWSTFFPIYSKIREESVGAVRHVTANFTYEIKNDRVWHKDFGCGGLRALGIYVLKFALCAFHERKLEKVSGNIKKIEGGIDMCGNILMEFEGNGTAFLSYHLKANGDTSAAVYGETGSLLIPKYFWAPDDFILNGRQDHSLSTPRNDLSFNYNFDNSWGFIHEIKHVAKCIEQGLLESPLHSLSDTLKLANIMEHLLKES